MFSRLALFKDLSKPILTWFANVQYTPDRELHTYYEALPRATHYSLELDAKHAFYALHVKDPSQTHDSWIMHAPSDNYQRRSQKLSSISPLCRQLAMLFDQPDGEGGLSMRQSEIFEVLNMALWRQITEDAVVVIDVGTCDQGVRLGVTTKSCRTDRVLTNRAFEFPYVSDEQDVIASHSYEWLLHGEATTRFEELYARYNGPARQVLYNGVASLEGLLRSGQRLDLPPRCWPLLAFTALGMGHQGDRPGLALKTCHGWIVVMREPQADLSMPYRCYSLPKEFERPLGLCVGYDLNDELFEQIQSVGLRSRVA